MQEKFEQNLWVKTTRKSNLFDKNDFFKTTFDRALTPFRKTSLLLKQLLKC